MDKTRIQADERERALEIRLQKYEERYFIVKLTLHSLR